MPPTCSNFDQLCYQYFFHWTFISEKVITTITISGLHRESTMTFSILLTGQKDKKKNALRPGTKLTN